VVDRENALEKLAAVVATAQRVAIDGVDAAGKTILATSLRRCSSSEDNMRSVARSTTFIGPRRSGIAAATSRPGQQLYLDEVDPRRLADVVFENTKPESPSLVFREKAARSSHAAPLLRPQE